jgi:hypothetical protein
MRLEDSCVLGKLHVRYISLFARGFLVLTDLEAGRMQVWSRRRDCRDIEARLSDHNAGNR